MNKKFEYGNISTALVSYLARIVLRSRIGYFFSVGGRKSTYQIRGRGADLIQFLCIDQWLEKQQMCRKQ